MQHKLVAVVQLDPMLSGTILIATPRQVHTSQGLCMPAAKEKVRTKRCEGIGRHAEGVFYLAGAAAGGMMIPLKLGGFAGAAGAGAG